MYTKDRALKCLENVKGHKGCCQSVYLRLYSALALPVMDYGHSAAVTATSECITAKGQNSLGSNAESF